MKTNESSDVYNFVLFFRGLPINDTVCEDICTLSKTPFAELNSLDGITIPKWTLHYFRCYKYDYGNNEKASAMTSTGIDVVCTGRMEFYVILQFGG